MYREDFDIWQCGSHAVSLARPRIMGVLNVTPDSFSDGGTHNDPEAAIAWGLKMLDEGADIIDVGGESTRPGFTPVDPAEELERVLPVVRALAEAGAVVSIDTRHPDVARECVKAGAAIVNDVTGFTNPEMVHVVTGCDCGCVVMHAGEVSATTSRRSVTLDSAPKARPAATSAGLTGSGSASTPAGLPKRSGVKVSQLAKGRKGGSRRAVAKAAEGASAQAQGAEEAAAPEVAAAEAPAPAEPKPTPTADDRAAARLDEVMRRSARGITSPTVRLAGGARRFTLPDSGPIMRHVMGFLGDRARELMRAGVARERICIDPGAGFGKLADEDVVIQRATAKMASLGYPVLCAVSRKRFVGAVSAVHAAPERDAATAGVCIAAVESGARILRVHDVAGCAQALDSYWSCAHPDPRRAFVALGSNVGDRVGYLARAAALIDELPLTCVTAVSHAYETDPAYGIALPVANAVAEIRSELAPLVLMDALLGIEDQLGRTRQPGQEGHGPRTIDLDLLWMEGEAHAGNRLELPHPRLGERDFVIVPMEDLMHDPVRFLTHEGIEVAPREERVGLVRSDLGEIEWGR